MSKYPTDQLSALTIPLMEITLSRNWGHSQCYTAVNFSQFWNVLLCRSRTFRTRLAPSDKPRDLII